MPLNQSAINLLNQIDGVVSQLNDEQYKQPIGTLSNSSIGQHVRHTLEFFICLIDTRNEKKLNYDNRKHDKFIEQETRLAHSIIQSIKEFLIKESTDTPLTLEANYTVDKEEIVRIPSTFSRELAYNIEHAIHHMALIKIGISTTFPHVKLADHFGVASSTVRYQIQQHS